MPKSFQNSDVKTYLFRYFHEGAWWQLELPATSADDARARMRKLPLAQLDGELVAKIPASAGLFARGLCWLHNILFWRKCPCGVLMDAEKSKCTNCGHLKGESADEPSRAETKVPIVQGTRHKAGQKVPVLEGLRPLPGDGDRAAEEGWEVQYDDRREPIGEPGKLRSALVGEQAAELERLRKALVAFYDRPHPNCSACGRGVDALQTGVLCGECAAEPEVMRRDAMEFLLSLQRAGFSQASNGQWHISGAKSSNETAQYVVGGSLVEGILALRDKVQNTSRS